MAFTLASSVVERNDNKLLTMTDTTGTGVTGWGNGSNPAVTDIDGSTHTLTLDIKIKTSDSTETTYDTIDLYAEFGPFTTTADLVFALDCTMLEVSGVAYGTTSDVFPDGIYEMIYSYDKAPKTPTVSTTGTLLIDGVVTAAIYELLRTVSTKYECGGPHEKTTLDIIFLNTYLDCMHASAYVAREESVLSQLSVIEDLITNVSTYTW